MTTITLMRLPGRPDTWRVTLTVNGKRWQEITGSRSDCLSAVIDFSATPAERT